MIKHVLQRNLVNQEQHKNQALRSFLCLNFWEVLMKIVIIGYSGSGKSTLAGALSRHYSIPKLHMDTLQFQPGWVDSDRDWMEGQMKQFLSQHKDWVIDGNYSWCCYEERMEQADHIIFLNFSRWNCLYRAWKRYRRYKGRVREYGSRLPWTLWLGIHPLDPLGRSN